MAENCRVMQPCNVEFNLEEDAFCVLFGRLLVPFETLYKSTARFELDTETRQLKLTSSDWNSFTAAKKLIEQLLSATLARGLRRDYEDTVNEILTLAKTPKKHLLGKLRDVFIDCNNVAMASGLQSKNFWGPVMTVCEHFESKGHNVIMIVPTYRKKLANAEERNFIDLKEKSGQLKCVQSQVPEGQSPYDDRFLLQSCYKFDGVIVSNDRFTDFLDDPNFKDVIRHKVIRFMFLKGRFIPDPSMDLQKMLVKSSPFLDECEKMKNEPCPYGEKCNYGKKCRYMHEKPQQTRSARNRHFMRIYGPKTTKENMSQSPPPQTLNTCNNNLRMIPNQQSFNLPNRFAQKFVPPGTAHLGDFYVLSENQKRNLGSLRPTAPFSKMARNDDAPASNTLYGRPSSSASFTNNSNDSTFPVDEVASDIIQASRLPLNGFRPTYPDSHMFDFNVNNASSDQKPFCPWSCEVPTFSPEKTPFSEVSLPQHNGREDSHGFDQMGFLSTYSSDYGSFQSGGLETNSKNLQSQNFSYFSDGSSQSDDGKNSPTGSYVSSTDFSSIWLNEPPQERGTLTQRCQDESFFMEKDFDVPMTSNRSSPIGPVQSCVGFEKNQEATKSVRKLLASNENVMPMQDVNSFNSSQALWRATPTDHFEMQQSIFEKKSENVSFARNWAMDKGFMTGSEKAKTSPKVESRGKENVMLTIDSKVEDYNCVSQVLMKGKEAQILTVMKNHPNFNRQQIVEHVLAIERNDCCSSHMNSVKQSMEHCANLVGSMDCLVFVRAFLSAETRPKVYERSVTVYTPEFNQQVLRNYLGARQLSAPVRAA